MIRSAKYLLQPTEGQARRLDHLLWQQRNLYNSALAERKDAWQSEKRSVTRYEQFASLNGGPNPDLAPYGVCVARGTLTRLDLAYKAFYRRCKKGDTPGHPRFKGRYRWDSVSYVQESGWKLDTDTKRLRLMGVGHIRTKLHRALPGRPKTCIVKREGRRWWVVVQCDQVEARPLPATGKMIGIDLGVVSLLTTSDGEHLANPRFTKRAANALALAQRDLATKKRGSKRRRAAVGRVASQHRKVANCRRDLAHQTSRRLVNDFDLIAHEALLIPNMVRRPSPRPNEEGSWDPNGAAAKAALNRSIQDAGWAQLLRFVTYKAEDAGRELIAVDPRNTSRTCALCGHCAKENRQTQAVFRCLSCGHEAHADTNAAINILRAGLALRHKREVREVVA